MYHAFEFLKFGGHEEGYLIVLVVVFAVIFIFEKNPKLEKEEEVNEEENYEDEEYEEEVEEKEKGK